VLSRKYLIVGKVTKNNPSSLGEIPQKVRDHIDQLERIRRDFIANVSHELRTPLTVIRGYLEALLQKNLNVNQDINAYHKIFEQMFQHSIRMETIINDLLILSRLESVDQPLEEKQNINIKEILNTCCLDAERISGSKKHIIRLHADEMLRLNGAEEELKSLFSNIIINAVKYTPEQGIITVHWYFSNDKATFKVTDTGIGIAKEHMPRITERFYRADKARSRESGGTGLGLAIVKHVLMRHQAELLIESDLGKGSTFTCFFPKFRVPAAIPINSKNK
jgi:two-component system phosphate regulon sensor histidine kinase PhoR